MRQFFVDPSAVGESTITITGGDAWHIAKVLRLQVGDPIVISDTESWEYKCEIVAVDREEVAAQILDKQTFAREPAIHLTLFQGIPKGSKMETVIQKSTELGASVIVPVFMDRTQGKDRQRYEKKRERLQTIAAEAAKQCRRGRIPEVASAITGEELKRIASRSMEEEGYELVLMPYENEEKRTIKDVLRAERKEGRPRSIALIIGPEGGFSEEEAKAFEQAGAVPCSLGKTILRTETAGMVALSCILYELEW